MKDVCDIYELSPMQQGMLFHTLYAPDTAVYLEQISCTLLVDLDTDAFQRAWQAVAERHPVLRSAFHWQELDKPLQVVYRDVELPWELHDWRDLAPGEQQERFELLLAADRERSFVPERAPLTRFTLVRVAQASYRWIWTHHHLLLDGWSLPLVWQDVLSFYDAFCQGRTLALEKPPLYRDYIVWLQQQDTAAARHFWRERLRGLRAPTPLRLERRAGPPPPGHEGLVQRELDLPESASAALGSLSRQRHVTISTLLQGAWALVLHHYSGERDVLFGVTVSGRPAALPGVESMVGPFINTLPTRVRIDERSTFWPWLRELRDRQAQQEDFAYSPLADVQGWSELPAGVPAFDNVVVLENYPIDASVEAGTRRLRVCDVRSFEGTSYPLTVFIGLGDKLALRLVGQLDRFEATTVGRIAGQLRHLLAELAAAPERRLTEYALLNRAERHQLLVGWNDTRVRYPDVCLHHLFEAQVERLPRAVAVRMPEDASGGGHRELTYRKLDVRADQLASRLRALGVGPEVRVGLAIERCVEMVVAILGVLKAGGAYVPLDPAYPVRRLAQLLDDGAAAGRMPVVLTLEKWATVLSEAMLSVTRPASGARVIFLDRDADPVPTPAVPDVEVTPGNLAYVVYTSGSTGRPKGAMNTHRGVLNHMLWLQELCGLQAADRVLQKTPLSFDVSASEIFWPLLTGARLVLARPDGHRDGAYLVRLIAEQKITTAFFVPSLLRVFQEEPEVGRVASLQRVICGGEALPAELVESFGRRIGCELYNVYGPTEAAIDVTFWPCRRRAPGRGVPIGCPIANLVARVVDPRLDPVPVSVPGELLLGGTGLARGYLVRPARTAQSFVCDPLSDQPGGRLYKTGDLVRQHPEGELEFLGRRDHQVKLRGFRIEPGEVEAALHEVPAVADCAVMLREDDDGPRRLVAYVVRGPGDSAAVDGDELRRRLATRLPEHTLPAAWVFLDALPLGPHGKLDRSALPAPERRDTEAEPVAARTTEEETLAAIWGEVLKLRQVAVHDDFFALGGDSILAIQVVARAREAGLEVSPRLLFDNPTVAGLARAAADAQPVRTEQATVSGPVPLTPIQQAFFERDLPRPHHHNQSVLLEVVPDFRPDVARHVLACLLRHHDALRLRFERQDDRSWRQVNEGPDETVPWIVVDFSAVPTGRQRQGLESAAACLQASFCLSRGSLVRGALFQLGRGGARWLLAAHHLVVDGVSWRILLEDFTAVYRQLARGEDVRLPLKTVSFRDWAERLSAYAGSAAAAEELPYWTAAPRHAAVPLPVEEAPPADEHTLEERVSVMLTPAETWALLQEVPPIYNTEVNDVLLSALVRVFSRWTGDSHLLVDLEGHGREDLFDGVDLSRTVGWFTSCFPVVLELGDSDQPGEVLKTVKEQLRAVPGRGIGYGILRYLHPDSATRQRLAELPPSQVSFNYLGRFDPPPEDALFRGPAPEAAGAEASPLQRRGHPLEIDAVVVEDRLRLDWTYRPSALRRATIERLAEEYVDELRSFVDHCRSPEAGGFTPTDFPDTDLNQGELDALLAEL